MLHVSLILYGINVNGAAKKGECIFLNFVLGFNEAIRMIKQMKKKKR